MSNVNVVRKRAGTILSDGINKYFYLFCVVLWFQFGNLIVTLYIPQASSCLETYQTLEGLQDGITHITWPKYRLLHMSLMNLLRKSKNQPRSQL
jgi:hypothetical protein